MEPEVNCREVRERIQDLLDDRLPADERRRVEEHLASCAACEAERTELARTRALLAELPHEKAPGSFAADVLSRVGSRPTPRGRRLVLPVAFAGAFAAAAILVLAIVSLVLPDQETQDPTEAPETRLAYEESRAEREMSEDFPADAAKKRPEGLDEKEPGILRAHEEKPGPGEFAGSIRPDADRREAAPVLELHVRDPAALRTRVRSILAAGDGRPGWTLEGDGSRAKTRDLGSDRESRRSPARPLESASPPADDPRPARPQAERAAEEDDAEVAPPAAPRSRIRVRPEKKDSSPPGVATVRKPAEPGKPAVLTLRPDEIKILVAYLDGQAKARAAANRDAPAPVSPPGSGDGERIGRAGRAGPRGDAGGEGGAPVRSGGSAFDRRIAVADDAALLKALREAEKRPGNAVFRLVSPAAAPAATGAPGR